MMSYSIETVSVSARKTWILKPRKIKKEETRVGIKIFDTFVEGKEYFTRVSSFIKIIPFNIDLYFRIDPFYNVKFKNTTMIF